MVEGKGLISIWFFIGVLLLVYGIIILSCGHLSRVPSAGASGGAGEFARGDLVGRFCPADGSFLHVSLLPAKE